MEKAIVSIRAEVGEDSIVTYTVGENYDGKYKVSHIEKTERGFMVYSADKKTSTEVLKVFIIVYKK